MPNFPDLKNIKFPDSPRTSQFSKLIGILLLNKVCINIIPGPLSRIIPTIFHTNNLFLIKKIATNIEKSTTFYYQTDFIKMLKMIKQKTNTNSNP